MTKDGLIKHWKEVKAFKKGKKIRRWDEGYQGWVPDKYPSFDADCRYKIDDKEDTLPEICRRHGLKVGKVVKIGRFEGMIDKISKFQIHMFINVSDEVTHGYASDKMGLINSIRSGKVQMLKPRWTAIEWKERGL